MAMYEREGFCPNNSFLHYRLEKGETEEIRIINQKLGDRLGYMVYPHGDCDQRFYYSSIVALLYGEPDGAALKLTNHLQAIIPECHYAEVGRKIRLHDLNCAPSTLLRDPETKQWRFVANDDSVSGSKTIIQSPNWLVIVDNHNGHDDDVDVDIIKLTL